MPFSHSLRQDVKNNINKPGGREEIMATIEKMQG